MQPDQGTPEEENGVLQVHVAVLEGSFSVVGVVGVFFYLFKPGSNTPTLKHLPLTLLFWQQEVLTLKQLNP